MSANLSLAVYAVLQINLITVCFSGVLELRLSKLHKSHFWFSLRDLHNNPDELLNQRLFYSPDDLELRPMLFLDSQCQIPHLDLHIDHRRLMGLVKKCRGMTGSSGFPVAFLDLTQGNLLKG